MKSMVGPGEKTPQEMDLLPVQMNSYIRIVTIRGELIYLAGILKISADLAESLINVLILPDPI